MKHPLPQDPAEAITEERIAALRALLPLTVSRHASDDGADIVKGADLDAYRYLRTAEAMAIVDALPGLLLSASRLREVEDDLAELIEALPKCSMCDKPAMVYDYGDRGEREPSCDEHGVTDRPTAWAAILRRLATRKEAGR